MRLQELYILESFVEIVNIRISLSVLVLFVIV
jgi:hypothetical protein